MGVAKKKAPQKLIGLEKRSLAAVAGFIEKARLAEYVDLLNSPWRMLWLSFTQGVARGVGMAVGGLVVSALIVAVAIALLKTAFANVGGLPWVGEHLEQFIGWVLQIVNQHEGQ